MRRVVRPAKPRTLRQNALKWRDALLAEITRCTSTGEVVAGRFYNKYKHDEVRSSLQTMYADRCCYCEAPINVVTFDHIEHRKPKDRSLFPQETFEWSNLHLSCPKCNNAKGNKWDNNAPILDAAVDIIADHLEYQESRLGLLRWPKTDRGDTTICHADLDRAGLRTARAQIYMETLKTIREINQQYLKSSATPRVSAAVRELRAKIDDDFGSVIAWAIDAWLFNGL